MPTNLKVTITYDENGIPTITYEPSDKSGFQSDEWTIETFKPEVK